MCVILRLFIDVIFIVLSWIYNLHISLMGNTMVFLFFEFVNEDSSMLEESSDYGSCGIKA